MAGLTEFYCGSNEPSHASQFKWLEYTFKVLDPGRRFMTGPGSGSERLLLALSGKKLSQSMNLHEIIRLVLDELPKTASE